MNKKHQTHMAGVLRTTVHPIHLADQVWPTLQAMSADDRLEFLGVLKNFFCPECGGDQPAISKRCQCTNDE